MVDVKENDTGVFVFEDLHACSEELAKELEKYPYEIVVLGLDCEWVTRREVEEESPVCPVALLQLAFPHGRCFLIRLCRMNGGLPDKLRDILEDRKILKAGVGIGEDAKKLSSCYGLVVQGCVDLRHVASRCRGYVQHCVGGGGGTRHGMSLSALSQQILGVTLDKDWRIRCSNWEAPSLSERQIEYAADDAIVAVKIFFKLAASKLREKEERFEAGNTRAEASTSSSQVVLGDNSCGTKTVLLEPEANSETERTHETEIKVAVLCTKSSSADEIEKRGDNSRDTKTVLLEPEANSETERTPETEINRGVLCTESNSAAEIEKRGDNSCGTQRVLLEPEANSETERTPETEINKGVLRTKSNSADEIEKRGDNSCGTKTVLLEPEANSETERTPKPEINRRVLCTESNSAAEIEKRGDNSCGTKTVFVEPEANSETERTPETEIKVGEVQASSSEDSAERTSINSGNSGFREKQERASESSEKSIPDDDGTVSTRISSEGGILSGLLSKLSGFSLGSIFGTQAESKDRKSKMYSQYPSFTNLDVTREGLLASSELWSCLSFLCRGVVDVPYKVKRKQKNSKTENSERSKQGSSTTQARNKMSGLKPRRAPLYQNCVIEAPDGEMLSTCDKRKAGWYLYRDLADVVKDDPYTIRLKFEPSGRPLDPANNYYLTFKENMCVVCGRDDHYMRKNVIPHDYRKHFPICMKDHHSHDVLLLCPTCHMVSTHHDDMLRRRLAEKYNAPLASSQVARLVQDPELKKVKCAAKALVYAGERIPAKRREELFSTVKAFFQGENPSDEMLLRAAEMETRQENCDFISHGREVVRKVKEDEDLLNFERMWREHFLETMKPEYLPPLWTVDHEQKKVKILLEEELKTE